MLRQYILKFILLVIVAAVAIILVNSWLCSKNWCKVFPWQEKIQPTTQSQPEKSLFDECKNQGGYVSETFPRHCVLHGQTFVQDVMEISRPGGAVEQAIVTDPKPLTEISSPAEIQGRAVVSWFYNDTFVIKILNSAGREIGSGQAERLPLDASKLPTLEYIGFKSKVEFEKPDEGDEGFIELIKNHQNGKAEHDAKLRIPVKFK